METVAQRVGKGAAYLRGIHPDLFSVIKSRHHLRRNTEAARRRAEFRAEISRAVTELRQRGINPSWRKVFASIPSPSMRSTHILSRQIAATLREMEVSPEWQWCPVTGVNSLSPSARNHPMAARVWKHHLAKTAIGWVE